jgi:MFS family permease
MIRKYFTENGGNSTVMALSFARLGDAVGNSILFVVIPLYVAKLPSPLFPIPETIRVGILIAVFGVVTALLQPLMGAISDRVGKRKIFIQGGLLLMVFGSLGYVIAINYTNMLIFRTLQGLGVSLTVPAAIALIATSSQRRTRGGSMGIYTAFRMAGLAIGPLVGGLLFDRYGFDIAFYIGAVFILLGMLMVQIWVKDLPNPAGSQAEKRKKRFQVMDFSLLSAGILGAGFASLVTAGAFSMISPLETQFNARLNETAFGFGLAISALTLGRLIFQIPLGRWSDSIGRKPLIIGGLLLMVPATILMGFVGSTLQLSMARFVQGVASAGIAAPAFAVAADLSRKGSEGQQLSIITLSFGLGIGLGPLLAGLLAVYSFQLPFLVLGGLCLLAAWVVHRYVPETVTRQPDSLKSQVESQH